MATGIVSLAADEHGMPRVARILFAVNLVLYISLFALMTMRFPWCRRAFVDHWFTPARSVGFLTLVAGSCVLGSQCVILVDWSGWALALLVVGAGFWAALFYLFFATAMTERAKPGLLHGINGSWLATIVATQSLTTLLVLRAGAGGAGWLCWRGRSLREGRWPRPVAR